MGIASNGVSGELKLECGVTCYWHWHAVHQRVRLQHINYTNCINSAIGNWAYWLLSFHYHVHLMQTDFLIWGYVTNATLSFKHNSKCNIIIRNIVCIGNCLIVCLSVGVSRPVHPFYYLRFLLIRCVPRPTKSSCSQYPRYLHPHDSNSVAIPHTNARIALDV